MSLTIKLVCLCLFIGITSASAETTISSNTSEMLIVHVLLNGSDAGTYFMQKEADDFIVTGKQLHKIGIQTLPKSMRMSQPISLKSLHRWLGFQLDEQTGDLLLTVKPTLLPTHEESLLVKKNPMRHGSKAMPCFSIIHWIILPIQQVRMCFARLLSWG